MFFKKKLRYIIYFYFPVILFPLPTFFLIFANQHKTNFKLLQSDIIRARKVYLSFSLKYKGNIGYSIYIRYITGLRNGELKIIMVSHQ